jgi:hypothetical protein
MKLTVVADIHLSKHWDELEEIIPKRIKYLNPNRYFKEVISKLTLQNM